MPSPKTASSSMLGRLLVFLGAVVRTVQGQVAIISPFTVSARFNGYIQGSTLPFGAPFQGDRHMGTLVSFSPTHCIVSSTMQGNSFDPYGYNHQYDSQYEAKVLGFQETPLGKNLIERQIWSPPIAIMRRSPMCSLAKAAHEAEQKGAAAVIVVDQEKTPSPGADVYSYGMAFDTFGSVPNIPAVYIPGEDGEALLAAANRVTEPVFVELAWGQHFNMVIMEQWTSSASFKTFTFLKEFAGIRKVLNGLLEYIPYYHTFSQLSPDLNELCLDNGAKLCAADPDGIGPITGREVAQENVRQLCIHELYKVERESDATGTASTGAAVYNREFWEYVTTMLDDCPLDGKDAKRRFGKHCSEGVMAKIKIDIKKVQNCYDSTWYVKLEDQLNMTAWSPTAIRIDDWRYVGPVSVDDIVRSLCSEFVKKPEACKELTKGTGSTVIFQPSDRDSEHVAKAITDKLQRLKGSANELSEDLKKLAQSVESDEPKELAPSTLQKGKVATKREDKTQEETSSSKAHSQSHVVELPSRPKAHQKVNDEDHDDDIKQITRFITYWVVHWERVALIVLLSCLAGCGLSSILRGTAKRVRQWKQGRVNMESSDQCLLEMNA